MFYLSKNHVQNKPTPLRDWPTFYRQLQQKSSSTMLQRFYAHPPPENHTLLASVPLVALDLETTGLNWQKDSIVSIGLVEFSTTRIRVNTARYWMVNPPTRLHEQSILVHNITHSELASAPDVATILATLMPLLAGKVIVAHHSAIERQFLLRSAQTAFADDWYFPTIDTMALERKLVTERQTWWQRFTRPARPSLQLRACRARYGLPAYRQHQALTDAIACAELFQAQVSRLSEHAVLADFLDRK
ncbi:3'-5' exonuclease [Alteromonas ponticola]|uniref:3'-5' exonuclease n=1 Tax=Alteromonas ponticola TaxID=2720613 RepID=A0ABX1R3Z7_9ALTE|nr:3'-5' exonuclease [Alteromonas ponticola]NMH61158.1 3'-5' exonuclease [Alteromonas ponticola]